MADAVPPPSASMRLFIAWWPGPRTRQALASEQAAWGWPVAARPARADGLHITLHFLSAVDASRVPALVQCLHALPPVRGELRLTQRQVWSKGVAVLAPAQLPQSALALHAELGRRLAGLGFPVDPRPWRAHVTLARDARGAAPPAAPLDLRWPLRAPVIVQSVPGPGGGYRPIGG